MTSTTCPIQFAKTINLTDVISKNAVDMELYGVTTWEVDQQKLSRKMHQAGFIGRFDDVRAVIEERLAQRFLA